jgi:hypothetical protein
VRDFRPACGLVADDAIKTAGAVSEDDNAAQQKAAALVGPAFGLCLQFVVVGAYFVAQSTSP